MKSRGISINAAGLAFALAALDVGAGLGVVEGAAKGDGVQGVVGLSVAAALERHDHERMTVQASSSSPP
jgi:hypothetical protein